MAVAVSMLLSLPNGLNCKTMPPLDMSVDLFPVYFARANNNLFLFSRNKYDATIFGRTTKHFKQILDCLSPFAAHY